MWEKIASKSTVTKVTVSGSSVKVTYTAAADATKYDIYLIQSPWRKGNIKYSKLGFARAGTVTFTNVADGYYKTFVVTEPYADWQSLESNWVEFTVDTESHTITYDNNGGTGGPETQSFVNNSGEKLSSIVPTYPVYVYDFANWKDSSGNTYNPGDAIPSGWRDTKLTAQWKTHEHIFRSYYETTHPHYRGYECTVCGYWDN